MQEIKRITEDRDRGKGYSPTRQSAIFWHCAVRIMLWKLHWKKNLKLSPINNESGAVAKSYIRKGFLIYLIYEEMFKYLVQEIKRITEDRDRGKGYSPTRQSAK